MNSEKCEDINKNDYGNKEQVLLKRKESKSNKQEIIMKVNDNENKEHPILKRKESKSIKPEILLTFNEEDEKKDINIVYNEMGVVKKIKYISLDLLLKKIVIDDFLENNILLIYHFCQQCFCFIDTITLFTKINNCYIFFRSQGALPKYLSNIITFFNILVIEMYQYYKEIREDNPSLALINNFYENVVKDFNEESTQNNQKENSINIKVILKGNKIIESAQKDENYKINLTKKIERNSLKNNNKEKIDKNGEKETNFYCKNKKYNSLNDNIKSINNEKKKDSHKNNDILVNNGQQNLNNNSIIKHELEDNKINRKFSENNKTEKNNETTNYNNINEDNFEETIYKSNNKIENNLQETNDMNNNIKGHKKDYYKENILEKKSTNNLGIYKLVAEYEIIKKPEEINIDTKERKTLFDKINYSKTSKNLDLIDDDDEELLWSKKRGKNNIIEDKNEKKNRERSKEKKHFHIFGFLKKSKEKKLNKSCDVIRKSIKDKNNLRKSNTVNYICLSSYYSILFLDLNKIVIF